LTDQQTALDHSLDLHYNETTPPPIPESWKPFERLKELSLELAELTYDPRWQMPPPKPLDKETFLAVCACFAEQRRRAILRALILELLAEDIADLLSTESEADA
jgi:hypothetical protein